METSTNLMVLMAKIQCVEVFTFHPFHYSAPIMGEDKYEGEGKFLKAFHAILRSGGQPFIYITEKDESGWCYRHSITAYKFVQLLGFEILSTGLKGFTARMFANENGIGKDAEAVIAENTKEVYASFENGERYWKNMVAQEQDIADAKARLSAYEAAIKKYNETKGGEENIALDA